MDGRNEGGEMEEQKKGNKEEWIDLEKLSIF